MLLVRPQPTRVPLWMTTSVISPQIELRYCIGLHGMGMGSSLVRGELGYAVL